MAKVIDVVMLDGIRNMFRLSFGYDPTDLRIDSDLDPAIGPGISFFAWQPNSPRTEPLPNVLPFPVTPSPASLVSNRRRSTWPGTYAEYTSTPEYRRIAAQAKRDWNYQCLIDPKHTGPVEMHHRDYSLVPFGEDWRVLIPLCESCHRIYHARLPLPPIGLFDDLRIKAA